MNLDNIPPRPTVADEVKLGVDDAQVIAKTLPPVRSKAARVMDDVDHAVQHARGYVVERPMQSMLIAAAGGAVLAAGLLALARDGADFRPTPPRMR